MLCNCVQVDLNFPKNISDGARDLISKLLRHSPVDRLSLQSVIDHPWVHSNSRRVLPPICPAKKCWGPLSCLRTSPQRSVFICPSQQTLHQHVSVSLPQASNCHYSGTFYAGYKRIPTFFILYSVMSLSMFSMFPGGYWFDLATIIKAFGRCLDCSSCLSCFLEVFCALFYCLFVFFWNFIKWTQLCFEFLYLKILL